jgi:hypothetical protein
LKQAHCSQRCGRSLREGLVAESPTIALLAFIHDVAIAAFERERKAKLLLSDIMPSLRATARICVRTPTRAARGKAVKTALSSFAWLNRSMPVQRLPKGSAALSLEGCSASSLGSVGSGFGNAIRSRISPTRR